MAYLADGRELGNLGIRVPRKTLCVLVNDLVPDGVRKRRAKH